MSIDPYAHRRGLTFGQAEGVDELPRQLELREVSKELRAKLHLVLSRSMARDYVYEEYGPDIVSGAWGVILRDLHVNHRMGSLMNTATGGTRALLT